MSSTEAEAVRNATALAEIIMGESVTRAAELVAEHLDFYSDRDVDWPIVAVMIASGHEELHGDDSEFLDAVKARRRRPRLGVVR